jgi:two-component system, NarL family, nitrate/nitrite response regulator NarL
MKRSNVFIVDPLELFRDGIEKILLHAHFDIAGKSDNLALALELAVSGIDILVWTIDSAISEDLEVELATLCDARVIHSSMRVVALIHVISREIMLRSLAAGIDAVLSKSISGAVLARSLELVVLGQQIIPAQFTRMLAAEVNSKTSTLNNETDIDQLALDLKDRRLDSANTSSLEIESMFCDLSGQRIHSKLNDSDAVELSEREDQVLRCLICGSSNKAIARLLSISEATVKVYVKALLRKVRATNRTQVAIWGISRYQNGKVQGVARVQAADVIEGVRRPKESLGNLDLGASERVGLQSGCDSRIRDGGLMVGASSAGSPRDPLRPAVEGRAARLWPAQDIL